MALDPKKSGESDAFFVDWAASGRLDAESIADSSFSTEAGITSISDDFDTAMSWVFLSGGTTQQTYTITNTITTSSGRVLIHEFGVPVE